jgi:RHS repeat-associated protein
MNRLLAVILALLAAFGVSTSAVAKVCVPKKLASGFFAPNSGHRAPFDDAGSLDFAGREADRNYELVSGQSKWLSRDPIAERGGVNLYGMVGNDAVNWLDMLGLDVRFSSRPVPTLGRDTPVDGPVPYGQRQPQPPTPPAPDPYAKPPGTPSGWFHWFGNWGGPGWANGGWRSENDYLPKPGDLDYKPPTGPRDSCYEQHDRCIHKCNEDDCKFKKFQSSKEYCVRGCDHELATCLRKVSPWLQFEAAGFDTIVPFFIHGGYNTVSDYVILASW